MWAKKIKYNLPSLGQPWVTLLILGYSTWSYDGNIPHTNIGIYHNLNKHKNTGART